MTFVQGNNGTELITCGRDQLIAVWNIEHSKSKDTISCIKLIPNIEEVEQVICVSPKFITNYVQTQRPKETKHKLVQKEDTFCLTGGQKGKIRIWNINSGQEVGSPEIFENGIDMQSKISDLHLTQDEKHIYILQGDIITHLNLEIDQKRSGEGGGTISLTCMNQYEILDFAVLQDFLVVATTSNVIKIYQFDGQTTQGKMVGVSPEIDGHTDAVLAVSPLEEDKPQHFVSCGKDQSVCVWKIHAQAKQGKIAVKLVAKGLGHSSYVGAVCATGNAIYSASKDGVLKLWAWSVQDDIIDQTDDVQNLQSRRNVAAHNSGK